MPYAVATVGVLGFLSGLAVASGHYVVAGFLIAIDVAVALWLRYWTFSTIDQAFEKGAGFGVSTRARIRALPEAKTVPNGPLPKKKFLPHDDPPPMTENLFVSEHRRFVLYRTEDVTGKSGTGVVAWGVMFPDGYVATRWNGDPAQTSAFDTLDDVLAVHGHAGATRIVWLD